MTEGKLLVSSSVDMSAFIDTSVHHDEELQFGRYLSVLALKTGNPDWFVSYRCLLENAGIAS